MTLTTSQREATRGQNKGTFPRATIISADIRIVQMNQKIEPAQVE